MKQSVEKKKKTNGVAIGMMKVCVQMFNNCFVYYCLICIIFLCFNCFSNTYQLLFVGYKSWTHLISVLVQFKFPLGVIWWCCSSTTLPLCIRYASTMLPLRFCYASIMFMLCLCYASDMFIVCFCCASVILYSVFYCATVMFSLKRNFNTIFSKFFYSHFLKDEYVTK